MEYRFRFTWWERIWFLGKLTVESLLKTRSLLIICGVWLAFGTLEEVMYSVARGGGNLPKMIAMAVLPPLFFFFLVGIVQSVLLSSLYSRKGLKHERVVGVRGGGFFSRMSTGQSWYPCNKMQTVHVFGPLIWFGWKRTVRDTSYFIVPTRLFDTKAKRHEFLEYVEQQRRQEPTEIDAMWKEAGTQADWGFSFEADEDLWVAMQTEVFETKRRLHMRLASSSRIGEEEIRRRVKKELIPDLLYGTWNVMGTSQGIYYQTPSFCEFMDWSGIRMLAETERFFHIYGKQDDWMLGLERTYKADLAEICQKHGIVHQVISLTKADVGKRVMTSWQRRLLSMGIVVGVMLVTLMAKSMRSAMADLDEKLATYTESETSYVFNPGNYAEYQPLEKQAEVLRSLDLQVSDEAVDSLQSWMEEWPEAREWVEGYPYTSLLTEISYPRYDEETWEVIGFSDQAYWFDLEGFDIGEDYMEILNGIQALSGGQFVISEVTYDTQHVDWENGRGFVQINFLLNGKPCEYKAKMESDWLDRGIISYVGRQLKKEHTISRLYSMDDDGQGLILFFRKAEWADQFRERTGKALFEEPVS